LESLPKSEAALCYQLKVKPLNIENLIYGWDLGPSLDGDTALKIPKLGYKVVHEPFVICYTNVPVTFRKLVRQRFGWDKSMIRFRVRKHRDVLLSSAEFKWTNFITPSRTFFST
jgi:biofilm PGA synthesis N-glycosyltransferase PgaC